MNMLTLFNSHGDLVASDQLVFPAEDIEPLNNLLDTISALNTRLLSANKTVAQQEKNAREQGFKEGIKKGRHIARKKMSRALLALEKERLEHKRRQHEQSIDLAIDIVRKIGLQQPTVETMIALAQKSAEELNANEKACLCVHPDLADEVTNRIQQQSCADWLLRVEPDDSLDREDCVLKTEFGVLRIGLESQLRLIERSLHECSV